MATKKDCRDIWNAFMCEGIVFSEHDIPYCPTTAKDFPLEIISWTEARRLYNSALRRGDKCFKHKAFVCFYLNDYKFDGPGGIWHNPERALIVLQHFAGVITPDFSTYQDFPEPVKIYNTYRMRVFGAWLANKGIEVINNVRWGTLETWWYCFGGLPKNSIYAIGTVGGSPRQLKDRQRFEDGLNELVKRLEPKAIIVYGSAKYPCFDRLAKSGIQIMEYPSETAQVFEERARKHE